MMRDCEAWMEGLSPGGVSCCSFWAEVVGNPQNSFRTVHVTGTNGKGSVSFKVANVLKKAGFRVGLYSSPHILSFTERITVDGVPIPEEDFVRLCSYLKDLAQKHRKDIGWFDVLTLMAFLYFKEKEVDFGVVEVGVGGTYDSTNIVTPCLSVITSVGFDHCELLGNTLEEIAQNKAGIIKNGVKCVLGPNTPFEYIKSLNEENLLVVAEKPSNYETVFEENTRIARIAIENLPERIPQEALEALEENPRCRMQLIEKEGKRVVVDSGHNPAGVSRLMEDTILRFPSLEIVSLVGIMKKKDINSILKIVGERSAQVHLCSCEGLTDSEELCLVFREMFPSKLGLTGKQTELLPLVLDNLEENQVLVVCGSFKVAKAAYTYLN